MDYLTLSNVTKIYPNGVLANDRVNFGLARGEIHAIVGENGAGKSTIMKVLYGLEKRESGDIFFEGELLSIESPLDAINNSIGMVPQHSMLVNEMTVSENIYLGIEPKRGGLIDKKLMINETRRLCDQYHMALDPNGLCGDLSVSSAQKVAILKALVRGAKILILDEPTAVLAPQETEELFSQLKLLKKVGHSIIIITHKLKEIKQLCDRVTVMRAGHDCGVFKVDQVSEEEISRLMVGGAIATSLNKNPAQPSDTVLMVNDLTLVRKNRTKAVDRVSFSVRKGEVLCFAGVEGNGQQETIRCITGLERSYSGHIHLLGRDISGLDIKKIRQAGLSHIPEDRLRTGSNQAASIMDNFISNSYNENCFLGILHYRKLRNRTNNFISKYGIKTKDLLQPMNSLSGGNMQKVIIAREFEENSTLIVADQPTRGVDVGATEFIHGKLIAMRNAGKAILLVSADISEVLGMADRILVFHNGRITAQITDIPGLTEEKLGRYMLGIDVMKNLVCI